MQPLSVQELEAIQDWVKSNQQTQFRAIALLMERLIHAYLGLLRNSGRGSLELLKLLRQAMGLIPKSERGSPGKHGWAIRE